MFRLMLNLGILLIARLAIASMGLITLTNTAQYKKRTLRKVRIGYNSGGATPTINYLDINARGVSLSPETVELITQGVSTKDKDREVKTYGLSIDNQYAIPALDEIALKGGYGDGVMPGDFFTIELTHTMINRVTGAQRTEVTEFLHCALTQADPAGGEAEQVVNTATLFESTLTTTDLLGAPLASVPAGGAFFKKTSTGS